MNTYNDFDGNCVDNNVPTCGTTKQALMDELEDKLKHFAHLWRAELYTEKHHYLKYNDSTRLFMDSIGKQMESIALTTCNYFFSDSGDTYEASGTGGSGYDLINVDTRKGVEVKSCNLIQNVICSCGRRYNPVLSSTCPSCGSAVRTERKDTRFGIDAKETIRQCENDLFDRFIFAQIDATELNPATGHVTLSIGIDSVAFVENDCFLVDSKEVDVNSLRKRLDPRLEYFYNQLENGKKAHCNLLPNSFDYYMLNPVRLFNIQISFSYEAMRDPIDVQIQAVNEYQRVPLEVCRKKEKELIRNTFVTYDPVTDTVMSSEFSQKMPWRKKNLGKERGDTTAHKDATLQRMWD